MRAPLPKQSTLLAATAATALACALLPALPATAAADPVTADFGTTTGSVRGGAAGALYGISDDGVPTYPVVAGAKPVSITTGAPNGAQHPNGDPLKVAPEFWATGGKTLFVNLQDIYPDFPYNGGNRPSDFQSYLDKITIEIKAIKAADPSHFSQYVFVPFNEPDGGNWYGNYSTMKNQFLADWSSAWNTIKAVDSSARIGGPGLAGYSHDRLNDLLNYAKPKNQLPDVLTWHELNRGSLANFRSNYNDYRAAEKADGVAAIPINITEWGDRSDLSVPGQLIQWIAMLETAKVDGNTAYWTYAGNLNENMSGTNAANGGWWLTKWYGDLTGNTVALTPPAANTPQTVQGIATIDTNRKQGTVLLGGGSGTINLSLKNLSTSVFGSTVDVTVTRDSWTGYEGTALQPKPFQTQRFTLANGTPSIAIPNANPMDAYQVIVTPAAATTPALDRSFSTAIEAENTTLSGGATAYTQDTDADPQKFATSGKKDVGNLGSAAAALTWNVNVPANGGYQLSIFDGAKRAPGRAALFVDGTFNQIVQYSADLDYLYRNRTPVTVNLGAGSHSLSLRTSKDGQTALPGSNVAIDRIEMRQVVGAETATYPARFARSSSASPVYTSGKGRYGAVVTVGDGNTQSYYLAAADTGYYDLAIDYYTPNGATALQATLNGRALTGIASTGTGGTTSTVRVHLAAGISELKVTSTGTAQIDAVRTTRATAGDSATIVMNPGTGTLSGAAKQASIAGDSGSNTATGSYVGYIGNGSGNTCTINRPNNTPAGFYDLDVHYANNDQNSSDHYNTDVISRFMTVTEPGGSAVTAAFRNDFSWINFWWRTVPLSLKTGGGALVLGNSSGYAPDIDQLKLSPLQTSSSTAAYNG